MSTEQQLQLRALRLLNDGHKHARTAWIWAKRMTDTKTHEPVIQDGLSRYQFTGRELSLGVNFE